LNSPSKVLTVASEEKSIIFSPKLHDSSMVHKEMEIETSLPLKCERDSIDTCEEAEMLKLSEKACMGEECIRFPPNELEASTTKGSEADTYFDQTTLSKLFDNSDVGGVEDENHSSTTSTKRKRSDVDDTNSDEEVKADEFVPTVSQSSEMMSCTFSLQQLFASGKVYILSKECNYAFFLPSVYVFNTCFQMANLVKCIIHCPVYFLKYLFFFF
jgi:hypothetical protein